MSLRSRTGGVRQVIQLSNENALAVFARLTPPGSQRPPFGAISSFFNHLVDAWRVQEALKEKKDGPDSHPQPGA